MNIKTITTDELRRMDGTEGLVIQGCGGDLTEWVNGINNDLTRNGILLNGTKFSDCSSFRHEGHATQLIRAAWALHMLSANLITHLAGECGSCDGKCGSCDGECPYSKADFAVDIQIPEEFREIADIPDDAVLHAEFPEKGGILICESIGDPPGLWDVPAPMMGDLLAAGVCPASLELLMKSGEAVYGNKEAAL